MPIPPITNETAALLARILPPDGKVSTPHTDAVYALVEPLHDFLHQIDDELTEVDRLRRLADRAEDAPYAYAFFERIKQTVDAARRQSQDVLAALDALTDTKFQLDEYARQMQASLESHYERTNGAS